MYGGKYIGLLTPDFNWGTHFVINREAYLLLHKETKKDPRFELTKNFPTWKQINIFEELNGPDGLWLEGKLNSSSMHYNPINGHGEAPQGIRKNFVILEKILKKKRSKINILRAARRAAFLSHLVADVLNPPHHFGRYANLKMRYFLWLINSDWKEEGTGGFKKGVSFEYHHRVFEIKTFFKLLGNDFGNTSINYDFIKNYQFQKRENPFLIQNKAISLVEEIYKLNIYKNFLENGWSKKTELLMTKKVFPQAISWVATFWLLAILESKDLKY